MGRVVEAMAQKCCCCIPLKPGVMGILVILFVGDLDTMYNLQQQFGLPWDESEYGFYGFSFVLYRYSRWVFAVVLSLVSVGVIFYAHKGISTSSATVLRYLTGYAACKLFYETFINMIDSLWRHDEDVNTQSAQSVTIIGLIIGLVLTILIDIHYVDVFKSLADEVEKDQGDKGSSS